MKLEAKTSAVGSGGAWGAFYRVTDDEARCQRGVGQVPFQWGI
jgi:hypothetical protein